MEKERKMTKRDYFGVLADVVREANVENEKELLDFINKQVELLDKKRTSGAKSARQKENETLVEVVFEALAKMDKPVTITEFQNATEFSVANGFSNQRVSALMKKLVDAGRVDKQPDGKKSVFTVLK